MDEAFDNLDTLNKFRVERDKEDMLLRIKRTALEFALCDANNSPLTGAYAGDYKKYGSVTTLIAQAKIIESYLTGK